MLAFYKFTDLFFKITNDDVLILENIKVIATSFYASEKIQSNIFMSDT